MPPIPHRSCHKRHTHVAAGRQLLYVLDDLNAPRLDPYETAMPIALIRQYLGYGEGQLVCFMLPGSDVWY